MGRLERQGLSTIEVLIALVVLSTGVLGTLGTMALAWRTQRSAERLALATRTTASVFDSLRAAVLAGGRECAVLSPGRMAGPAVDASWTALPVPGGRRITLTLSYLPEGLRRPDSAWTLLPCDP